uniref:AlNc14C21G2171 protein n=1 Tax=Albugo laibachii Nc14 TaxID=890382 RepID=F0W5K6_9STRA|nr:AlNc14C21G2171 [Albugo laibachii Nc14]|eukprot:CCA16397.1 AlNc14C21G2171 [Albugo laibachii Nc14]
MGTVHVSSYRFEPAFCYSHGCVNAPVATTCHQGLHPFAFDILLYSMCLPSMDPIGFGRIVCSRINFVGTKYSHHECMRVMCSVQVQSPNLGAYRGIVLQTSFPLHHLGTRQYVVFGTPRGSAIRSCITLSSLSLRISTMMFLFLTIEPFDINLNLTQV